MICPHCGEDTDDYIEDNPDPTSPAMIADLERRAKDGDWIASSVLFNLKMGDTSKPFMDWMRRTAKEKTA